MENALLGVALSFLSCLLVTLTAYRLRYLSLSKLRPLAADK